MSWYTIGGNVVLSATGGILDDGQQPGTGPTLANDPFPRSSWNPINPGGGSGTSYAYANATFQANAAKFNIVTVGPYLGIEQTMGNTTFSTIFNNIKTLSAANGFAAPTRCLIYTMSSEQSLSNGLGSGGTYTVWTNAVGAAPWYALTSWPSGTIVIQDTNGGNLVITSKNSATGNANVIYAGGGPFNALNIYQGYWTHYDGLFRQGVGASSLGYAAASSFAANTHLDGYEMDNVFCTPRQTAAWGMDTTSYAAGNSTAAAFIQQGQALQIAALRAINPNLLLLCNSDFLGRSTSNFASQVTMDPSIQGKMDIVYNEYTIGAASGIEGQGVTTTAQFMANLIAMEPLIAPNGTMIFQQTGQGHNTGWSNNSQASWTSTDWQAARFGMGCCFMRNYHYAIVVDQGYLPTTPFFTDEILKQSGAYGWLGAPIDAPQSAARTSGVWWRQFQNGVVFMNPAGNGSQTLTLASLGLSGLSAIANVGYGDATINTGLAVSSITLADRDGRFLIRGGGQVVTHGELFTLTGSGFGTRPNYNMGGWTWKGQAYMHYCWCDFSEVIPPTPSGNASTDFINWKSAGMNGLYPSMHDASGALIAPFAITPGSPPTGAALASGGPSFGGMYWLRWGNPSNPSSRFGGLTLQVSGTPAGVSNVSTSYPGEYVSYKYQIPGPVEQTIGNEKSYRRSYNFTSVPIAGGAGLEFIWGINGSDSNAYGTASGGPTWGNPLQASIGGANVFSQRNQVHFAAQFNRIQHWTDASGNQQFYCAANPSIVWENGSVTIVTNNVLPMWFQTYATPWGAGSQGFWSDATTFNINDLSTVCLFSFGNESALNASYSQNFADIYVDFTPTRVEVTDGTFSEPQVLLNWSNTQIQFLGNQGQLSSGAGTLNVYDNTNSIIQSFPVTIS